MNQKDVGELHTDLVVARADYLDNSGSEDADLFYAKYFRAYNAYWSVVDPSKVRERWTDE